MKDVCPVLSNKGMDVEQSAVLMSNDQVAFFGGRLTSHDKSPGLAPYIWRKGEITPVKGFESLSEKLMKMNEA